MDEKQKKQKAENVILVGEKPTMSYVTAVIMQFNLHEQETVSVCSRGRFIARVVDVVEIIRNRFLKGIVEVQEIKIGSEEFTNKESRKVRVSTIEIILKKKR